MLLGFAAILIVAGCASPEKGVTSIPGEVALYDASYGTPSALTSVDRSRSFQPALSPSGIDELWVIARSEVPPRRPDEFPGCGALQAKLPDETEVPLPLQHTAVNAGVNGYMATVEVRQAFENPYDHKIEAIYLFPLPHNSAINEFVMTIGERRIRGLIREREEAEQIYRTARRQGYVASLLIQERPNIFRQSVANIEPGKQIDVNITYLHTLAYVDGWHEFVFPMVVGPRFNPPATVDGVGAVARGQAGRSGQNTEVHYLKPGERSGHDISLRLQIEAGVAIEEHHSRTHVVSTQSASQESLVVELSPHDRIANKDFVFRYRVAGDRVKSSLLTHRDERGGFFTLMVYPPADLKALSRMPLELVFVLDCSGSMRGRPLAQAKEAIARGLRHLGPEDTFQLIRFSNDASQLGSEPLPATVENVHRGLRYLERLNSEGGTMMIHGIRAALDFPHDPRRLRFVAFMTDGYIGNEAQILAEIQKKLGAARIFSFGTGSSVNRYLLDQMARIGRGAAAYLGPNDSAAAVMDDFFARISHPALTDLTLDWGELQASDIFPRRVPDLFVGRPVILAGRIEGNIDTPIRVQGKTGGETVRFEVAAGTQSASSHEGIATIWARAKLSQLADEMLWNPDKVLPEQIKQTALDYNLVSPYTAFLAVDASRQAEGETSIPVPVAVPVPEGVPYDTTVISD